MTNHSVLDVVIKIRQQLIQPRYDKGELSGLILLSAAIADHLKILAAAGLSDSLLLVGKEYIDINKLQPATIAEVKVPLTIYTRHMPHARYYETLHEFAEDHPYSYPAGIFYIHELSFDTTNPSIPAALKNYKDVVRLIALLAGISDYITDNIGEPKGLVFFNKRKLVLPVIYHQHDLRNIDYLDQLTIQLQGAHDKEERKSIFISELISLLFPITEAERFGRLLASLDTVYENYLKSHLLYLEKFSYHDLKLKVDKDKLDYTKKIYATVNDIQAKLIAVPAAFLLVLAQFDLDNTTSFKNILITIGALLFSILLEVLLRNQFGVLKYIETEIFQFKGELKNSETSVDLTEFIKSFSDLERIARKQRIYLWIFRVIVWLVPLCSFVLLLYNK